MSAGVHSEAVSTAITIKPEKRMFATIIQSED
jgi:hypothetical protein